MVPARDRDDFIRDPVGRYVVLPSGLVFCMEVATRGFALWGAPSPDEVRTILAVFREIFRQGRLGPWRCLAHFKKVAYARPDLYPIAIEWFSTNVLDGADHLTSLAIVRPEGLVGMILTGFRSVFPNWNRSYE